MRKISITSEIGRLKKVIIHSPGFEIETMTPKSAEQVLYNDIINLPIVAQDHKELRNILNLVAKTYETKDIFIETMQDINIKTEFIDDVCKLFNNINHRKEELMSWSADKLVKQIIEGVPQEKKCLTSFLSDTIFDLPPLPNLFFMRDSAIVVGSDVITGSMATKVRMMEALIMEYIFKYNSEFKADNFIFDGIKDGKLGTITIEGGDLIIISKNVLAIGISERTTSQSVDLIIENISKRIAEPLYIFAVVLPKERATIHLDMVFTMINTDACVIHKPYILDQNILPVVKISIIPNKNNTCQKIYEYVPNLLVGLRGVGIDLKPIICGGSDNVLYQDREQWLSGTNFFAFAPGKIIGYACNSRTLNELDKNGYEIKYADDILNNKIDVENYKKLVIGIKGAELARGGGGVRCMTMPILRDDL